MIPTIDIQEFRHGSAPRKQAIAREVDTACRAIGFLSIVRHGIEPATIDELFALAREFYALPEEEKRKAMPAAGTIMRGYAPPLSQNLARSRGEELPPDIRESFMMGRPGTPPVGDNHPAAMFFRPNVWPLRPHAFRARYEAYYAQMEVLAGDLMRLFALALGLPEHYFNDKIHQHFATLNTIHYPPLSAPPRPGQLRAGAHSDFGSLTILKQDASSVGLEVQQENGHWFSVPPIPGAYVINIGDLMAHWTGQRWRSTVHRVVNPVGEAGMRSRQSLAFFCHPNYDAIIEPVFSSVDAATTWDGEPLRAGEYMRRKLLAVRSLAKGVA